MLDSWLSKKAEEINSSADKNGMKMFHNALKSSGTTLMTDKDVVLNRRGKRIVCVNKLSMTYHQHIATGGMQCTA